MKLYAVYQPTNPDLDADERLDQTRFVRDGFSLFAFIAPAIWAAFNQLWLVLLGYIAAVLAIEGAFQALGATPWSGALASLVLNLWFGLEAHDLQRWTLRRKRFEEVDVVAGTSADDCELRFFENDAARQTVTTHTQTTATTQSERPVSPWGTPA